MSFEGEQRSRPGPPRERRTAPPPPRKRTRKSRVMRQRAAALAALVGVAVVLIAIIRSSSSSPAVKASSTAAVTHPHSSTASTPSNGTTTASSGPGNASVPILVYHVINAQPTQSSADPALYVPADEFSSQMQALKSDGWHAVTLDQLAAYWARGASLGSGKPIVITFDNGYASHYLNALPVLKRLGWVGVENLPVTGLPPSDGGLSDTQVRGLIAGGWELDSQGLTNAPLAGGDPTRLVSDLTAARQTLHSRYGVPVNWFSYPSGSYDATVVASVRAAGYAGATTISPGWAGPQEDRFRLPRLVVVGGTTPTQLLTQISSAKATTSTTPTTSSSG